MGYQTLLSILFHIGFFILNIKVGNIPDIVVFRVLTSFTGEMHICNGVE